MEPRRTNMHFHNAGDGGGTWRSKPGLDGPCGVRRLGGELVASSKLQLIRIMGQLPLVDLGEVTRELPFQMATLPVKGVSQRIGDDPGLSRLPVASRHPGRHHSPRVPSRVVHVRRRLFSFVAQRSAAGGPGWAVRPGHMVTIEMCV
ncbi:hypothetical protein GCM10009599_03030 [Luteococcus peritonei]